MGMYTEFYFNARLKEDVPLEVVNTLNYMLGGEKALDLPDHELFKTARWDFMLRCDSYCFDADTHSTLRFDDIGNQYSLCIRCNFKNYDDEIEKFISWVKPYLDKYEGEFLGFYRYEECEQPTLVYM